MTIFYEINFLIIYKILLFMETIIKKLYEPLRDKNILYKKL